MSINPGDVRGFSYNGETAYAPVDTEASINLESLESDYYMRRVLVYAHEMDRIYAQQGKTPGIDENGNPHLLSLPEDVETQNAAFQVNAQLMEYIDFMINPDPTLMINNLSIVKDQKRYRTLRSSPSVVYNIDDWIFQARIVEDAFSWRRKLTSRGYVLYLFHVDEQANLITKALYRFNYKNKQKDKPLAYDYAGYPIISQEQYYFVVKLLEELSEKFIEQAE